MNPDAMNLERGSILFNRTIGQRRSIGRRGGRAHARNPRAESARAEDFTELGSGSPANSPPNASTRLRASGRAVCLLVIFQKPKVEWKRIVHGFPLSGPLEPPPVER